MLERAVYASAAPCCRGRGGGGKRKGDEEFWFK